MRNFRGENDENKGDTMIQTAGNRARARDELNQIRKKIESELMMRHGGVRPRAKGNGISNDKKKE